MQAETSTTPSASREEREQGLRLYFVVRSDLALSRSALIRLAAQATWRAMERAGRSTPAQAAEYGNDPNQPKIALRVKTPGHLQRACHEAQAAGLPAVLLEAVPGLPAIVGIGPATRADLPPFVRRLQMLEDEPQVAGLPVPEAALATGAPTLWIVVRDDAGIPFGKLAPQAGHGCWSTLRISGAPAAAWDAAGCPVGVLAAPDLPSMRAAHMAATDAGLPSAFIVDNGHTVFLEPTPTVVGIGPCPVEELPELCRGLLPVRD